MAKSTGTHSRAAMGWMVLAVFSFVLMDAGMKGLAKTLAPFQIAAIRALATLPVVLVWIAYNGKLHTLWKVHWHLHVLRGLLGMAMIAGFVYGLARMPLTTAYAISFVSPLLVTALAVPLLGEKVGPRRWAAIVMGMVGVLVVLRPGGEGVATWAGLAVLASALCYAAASITVRVLAQRDSTEALVFWFLVLMSIFSLLLAWRNWQPVVIAHWPLIALVGLAGAVGQVTLTHAFRLGQASHVAPLEYSALVWVLVLDRVVWKVLPDALTWLGAGIIVASGLYLFAREKAQPAAEKA